MRGTKPQLVVDNGAMGAISAPASWLSKEAKAEWQRVMPGLIERRILTDADLGSLENYCIAQGRVREVEGNLSGKLAPDDWAKLVRTQDKAMQTARQLAAELGLTPVSRSRPALRSQGGGDDDPLDLS